jgi:hypothetical protein
MRLLGSEQQAIREFCFLQNGFLLNITIACVIYIWKSSVLTVLTLKIQ